jgi:hypothetical protein
MRNFVLLAVALFIDRQERRLRWTSALPRWTWGRPAFAKPASSLRSRFGGVGSVGEGRSLGFVSRREILFCGSA